MIMINPIYGQSLIKENCHNSRTSHDINTRLGPVTILGKINKATLKRTGDDPMSVNRDFIIIFSSYGQLGAIGKPDSTHSL